MLFLLPKQNVALVLQQNLYGLLQNEAVMQVGFGAARILADGRTPTNSRPAAGYHAAVWGVTALAPALIVAAGRSALLLRRPVASVVRLRRFASAARGQFSGGRDLRTRVISAREK